MTEEKGQTITLETGAAVLSDGAEIKTNETLGINYITGISSESGKAEYVVNVPEKGTYKLTITYSNNRENGVHSYNVDLVEDFITISVNGVRSENLYCRNTYSHDAYTTVTTNIILDEGDNTLTFANDGANKFNDGVTYAPDIAEITVNKTIA